MRRRVSFLAASVVVAAVLAMLAGCSGKGSSTTAPTAATAAGGSTTTTERAFSGSKDSHYCNLARQFPQTVSPTIGNDPKALFAQFDSLSAQFLAAAPSDIKADLASVINTVKPLEAKLKSLNYDYTKLGPTDLTALQEPSFLASLNRINDYNTKVCGVTTSTT